MTSSFETSCINTANKMNTVAGYIGSSLCGRRNTLGSALREYAKQQRKEIKQQNVLRPAGWKLYANSPICRKCGSRVLVKLNKDGSNNFYCPRCKKSDKNGLEYNTR